MIKFKTPDVRNRFFSVNPILILIILDASLWAKNNHGVDLVITDGLSSIQEDKLLNRKSTSHREGRAVDIRTKDQDAFFINELIEFLNENNRWKNYHYMSNSGESRLAYWHNNGNGEHLHVAIHSKFKQ